MSGLKRWQRVPIRIKNNRTLIESSSLAPRLKIGVGFATSEAEIAERAARFLKAELKRANVTYDELAERLKEHGLSETRNSIAAKLKRGARQ